MPGTPPEPGNAPSAPDADETRRRLDAYAYLSVPERLEYLAIMRVFCGTLLADLAVPDVMAKLREGGGPASGLDAGPLTARLEQLVKWGNLPRGSHTVKASSITEYQRSRARYQLSRLGERVQRDADGVLAEADAAREVSNELLALVERGLRELAELVAEPGGIAPQDELERISTLFVQFTGFADSVRDFYAYLGQVLARYDLDGGEYQGFKELLLDYVEAITEDVSFRTPASRRPWTCSGPTSRTCWSSWTLTRRGSPGCRHGARAVRRLACSAAGVASSRTGRGCGAGSGTPTGRAAR